MIKQCKICGKEYGKLKSYERKRNKCSSCHTKIRRFINKERAVAYLGGKCNRCGYTNQEALEFHHIDKTTKDFNIGCVANKSWDSILKEIKKCELLCSNCHRIEHTNRNSKEFIEAVIEYKKNMETGQVW